MRKRMKMEKRRKLNMAKFKIKETGEFKELSLYEVKNGVRQQIDYFEEVYCNNEDTFLIKDTTESGEGTYYLISQESFEWWKEWVENEQEIEYAVDELGIDWLEYDFYDDNDMKSIQQEMLEIIKLLRLKTKVNA